MTLAGRRECDRCAEVDAHLCLPRAQRVVDVFEQILVHTKTRQWARKPFLLMPWQRDEIIVPLFGRVVFSEEWGAWVRQHQEAWLELGRKNGKSSLAAGIALVLLVADDEDGAEIYSVAKDKDQARKVFDVAARMVKLSPLLSSRIQPFSQAKTLVDDRTGSIYQAVPADAAGNLGHNASGVIFDEVITQPDRLLWDALKSSQGVRQQPLFFAVTTAGDDEASFAFTEHTYSERIARDPALDPRRFVFMRNTPLADARGRPIDPFDEKNWAYANPGLDTFLSREFLRAEALAAKNDPPKEHAFRQFYLNQWQQRSTTWMLDHVWDACTGVPAESPAELDGRALRQRCFGGLDLSATTDLTALCWVFPDLGNLCLWRCWIPDAQVATLNRLTGGRFQQWIDAGWITVTPESTIDYDAVYAQIDADRSAFRVVDLNFDRWAAAPLVQELEKRGLIAVQIQQGFALSEPLKEIMRLAKSHGLIHGGNPVARWNLLSTEVRQDARERYEFVKPVRGRSGKRIDLTAALVFAVDGLMRRGNVPVKHRRVVGF